MIFSLTFRGKKNPNKNTRTKTPRPPSNSQKVRVVFRTLTKIWLFLLPILSSFIQLLLLLLFSHCCIWLFNPMDCDPPGSSVHRISQARILEWVAVSFSRGSSQSRDWTHVSYIERKIIYHWATREPLSIVLHNRKTGSS